MSEKLLDTGIILLGKNLQYEDLAHLQRIYADNSLFPIDLRLSISDWIEESFVPLIPSGKVGAVYPMPQDSDVNHILWELIYQLDSKIENIPNDKDQILKKLQLRNLSNALKEKVANDPVGLYNTIIEKLKEEEIQFIDRLPVNQLPIDSVPIEVASIENDSHNQTELS